VGRGTASSEYGDHGAYLAVDPKTRRGCLMINYGHGGHDMRAVENVKSLRSELRRTLRAEAADLIALCDGAGKIEIDIDVPSELPRLRARGPSKTTGLPTTQSSPHAAHHPSRSGRQSIQTPVTEYHDGSRSWHHGTAVTQDPWCALPQRPDRRVVSSNGDG
jgi:hypothetical protein